MLLARPFPGKVDIKNMINFAKLLSIWRHDFELNDSLG
jgi:hypothetical protein